MADPLIIVGRSTRAAAASAALAGYTPHAIGVDDPAQAPARVAAANLPIVGGEPPGVLYTDPMDRHPEVLEALAFDHKLLGCSPEAVRSLRDPAVLANLPDAKGLRLPKIRPSASLVRRLARLMLGSLSRTRFLRKPIPGQGGAGIDWWSASQSVGRNAYLQQHVRGLALTAVFYSDGWSCALIGVTDQIVGESAFGAGPFQVAGYVGPATVSDKARAAVSHLGVVLTQRHDLRGLFSVDLIMDHGGTLWPIDIDPRYPEATEVIERAQGIAALGRGPSNTKRGTVRRSGIHGKATIRCAGDVATMPDLAAALPETELADVATPGDALTAGLVVCTVFAHAPTHEACVTALHQAAAQVRAALGTGGGPQPRA